MAFENYRPISDVFLANTGKFPTAAGGLYQGYQQGLQNRNRRELVDQGQQRIGQNQQVIDQNKQKDDRAVVLQEMVGLAAALDSAQTPEEQQALWPEINAFRAKTGGEPVEFSEPAARQFIAKASQYSANTGGQNVQSTFVDPEGYVNIVRRDGTIVKTGAQRGQSMQLVDDGAGGKMLVSTYGASAGASPQTVVPTEKAISNAAEKSGAVTAAQTAAQYSPEATEARTIDAASVEAGKQAIKASGEARESLTKIRRSTANIESAIKALDEGANTGAIASRLPSVRQASIDLDNVRSKMGLDVVGATTFGALSKGELDLALSTALPTGLNEPQLRQWLVDKKAAQEKLAAELEGAAIFLGTPGNTVADYMQFMKENGGYSDGSEQPKRIKFDAQGNVIQ